MSDSSGTGKSFDKKKLIIPRYLIASVCFSLIFTVLLLAGGVVYNWDLLPSWNLLKESGKVLPLSPIIFTVLAAILYALFLLMEHKTIKEFEFLPKALTNPFVLAAFFAVFYGIVYLSFYPGTWCYDIIQQNKMILGLETLTKHHPPLHTFFWGLCLSVEKLTGGHILGIVFYSVVQILVSSLVYGRVILAVKRISRNDICVILSFLFFLLNPTFALFSFSPTKDPWCALAFLMAMVYVLEWIFCEVRAKEEKSGMSKKQIAEISAFLLLACLFRNNVIYGLILFGIVALIAFRKYWKTIALIGAIVLVGFLLIDKLFYGLLGIPDADTKEMLSVPIQQIGRVYRDYGETLSEEELEDIERYIGLDKIPYYNARISDPIKTTFKTAEFDKDKKGFVSLWFGLLKQHPDSYVIAYLSQYSPYWYFRSKSFDTFTNSPYVEVYISDDEDYSFERKGYLPFVNDIYTRIASGVGTQLLSRSLPFWITVTALFYALVSRRRKSVAIPLVCLCYLLTLFAGPLCIIRYTLPAFVCIPLMVISVICPAKE